MYDDKSRFHNVRELEEIISAGESADATQAQKLLDALTEDPDISDPSNISVTVEDQGLGKPRIFTLIGEVSNEREKNRAEEIVKIHTPETDIVRNELVTG